MFIEKFLSFELKLSPYKLLYDVEEINIPDLEVKEFELYQKLICKVHRAFDVEVPVEEMQSIVKDTLLKMGLMHSSNRNVSKNDNLIETYDILANFEKRMTPLANTSVQFLQPFVAHRNTVSTKINTVTKLPEEQPQQNTAAQPDHTKILETTLKNFKNQLELSNKHMESDYLLSLMHEKFTKVDLSKDTACMLEILSEIATFT